MEGSDPTVPSEDDPPLQAEASAPRSLGPGRAVVLLLGILLLYVAGELTLVMGDGFALIGGFNLFVSQMVIAAPLAVLALVALRLPVGRSLGIEKPSTSSLLLIAVFAVCNVLFVWGANAWIAELLFTPTEVFQQTHALMGLFGGADTPAETFWFFCLMVIGAPVSEELLFRGLLQNTLVRVWKPWIAVVVTALIFTLVHFHPIRFPVVFELGLILGLVYHRTGSLWLVVLFHAVTNFCGFSVMNSGRLYEPVVKWLETPGATALGLLGAVGFGFLLLREVRRFPGPDRSLRPGRMRWFYVLFRMIPLWVLAPALVLVSSFCASAGSRELKQDQGTVRRAVQEVSNRFETVAALMEFHGVVSELRAEVKQNRASTESLTAYLSDAGDKIEVVVPGGEARPKSAETTPLPWERDYLAWVREEVRTRFDVDIPTPEYDE